MVIPIPVYVMAVFAHKYHDLPSKDIEWAIEMDVSEPSYFWESEGRSCNLSN